MKSQVLRYGGGELRQNLNPRKRMILQAIVEEYIRTAEPVGSRTLSRIPELAVSPATIRNEMADLEELGLITQTHTSSGRVPTETGLRYYVDHLLDVQRLKEDEEDRMSELRQACRVRQAYLRTVLMEYTRRLSGLTNYPGLALMTEGQPLSFRKVQFLKLDEMEILVTLVSSMGTVTNLTLRSDVNVDQDELALVSKRFNEQRISFSLVDLNQELEPLGMRLDAATVRRVSGDCGEVHVEGVRTLFDHKEFVHEPDRIRRFLELVESKQDIARVLMEFLDLDSGEPVVKIGHELKGLESLELAIAGVPLRQGERLVGTLGLVGPLRMEYGRVLGLLDFFMEHFGDAFVGELPEDEAESMEGVR